MSDANTTQPRGLWALLTRPVGPTFIVGRRSTPPRAESTIASADLPPLVAEVVRRVTRSTRLWPGEKAEVAAELAAHFADALEAGRSSEQSIRDFGDPDHAARLIRRAKKRNRGLFYHAWVRAWQALALLIGALLLAYLVLLVRYRLSEPAIRRNYIAEHNAAVAAIPESQRAWPLYKQAILASPLLPEAIQKNDQWPALRPDDPRWANVEAYLVGIAPVLDLTRQAAALPSLGIPLSATEDPEFVAHRNALYGEETYTPEPPSSDNPPLIRVLLPHLGQMRALSRTLASDARLAAREGDAGRALADLVAIVGMAEHLRQSPFLISELVSFAVLAQAMSTAQDILAFHPDLFDRAQLVTLAHRLAAYNPGQIRARFATDRPFFEDFVQRLYSDDGSGDGRITPEGVRFLQEIQAAGPGDTTMSRSAAVAVSAPVLAAAIAGRRDLVAEYDRLTSRFESEAQQPMWKWTALPGAGYQALTGSLSWQARYFPLSVIVPAFGPVAQAGERATMQRDAALVALALEVYRRDTGAYPAALDPLAPTYLPSIPPDRFDGTPLKYALKDGRPLLYSVGADRNDDQGVAPDNELLADHVRKFAPPNGPTAPDGDWPLYDPAAALAASPPEAH